MVQKAKAEGKAKLQKTLDMLGQMLETSGDEG